MTRDHPHLENQDSAKAHENFDCFSYNLAACMRRKFASDKMTEATEESLPEVTRDTRCWRLSLEHN